MQIIESLRPFLSAVVVGFIHDQHQIWQVGQSLIKRSSDRFIQLFHFDALFVELIDVINVNMDVGVKQREILLPIVVIRNDLRR